MGVGAWRNVEVYVTIPATAMPGEQDLATVRVAGRGVTNTSTVITTAALHRVYLPLVVQHYQ